MKFVVSFIFSIFVLTGCTGEGKVEVSNAWVRSVPEDSYSTAAFMQIDNLFSIPIRLAGASSNDFSRIELHKTIKADGMMKMEKQENISIKGKDQLMLKPGSWHIMLFEPTAKKMPAAGSSVKLTLKFNNGKKVEITAVVKAQ